MQPPREPVRNCGSLRYFCASTCGDCNHLERTYGRISPRRTIWHRNSRLYRFHFPQKPRRGNRPDTGGPHETERVRSIVGDGTPSSCTEAALQHTVALRRAQRRRHHQVQLRPSSRHHHSDFEADRSNGTTINSDALITLSGPNISELGGAFFGWGTITNSSFFHNSAEPQGGAIRYQPAFPLTIRNSSITGNSAGEAGGGIYICCGRPRSSRQHVGDRQHAARHRA